MDKDVLKAKKEYVKHAREEYRKLFNLEVEISKYKSELKRIIDDLSDEIQLATINIGNPEDV